MAKFVSIDRESPLLLPYDLKDWIPNDHIVHFILDAVEMVNLSSFRVNHKGSGSAQCPPHMMLALLIYSYATGRFSSREIESATYSDIAVRYICGGNEHPDHDTICTFRRNNLEAFKESFLKVLMLAQELGHLKKVGGISVDGTKIKANASKHSAVSYKRAGEMIKQLELEIETLAQKAEEADSRNSDNGLSVPEEIKRRKDRKDALEKARNIIEERYEKVKAEKQLEYEDKTAKREKLRQEGRKPRGKDPQPPSAKPDNKAQYNFTDPESRIMKAGSGQHFEQCYNAQAAVDIEGSMLITGGYVTDNCNDKNELDKVVDSVDLQVRKIDDIYLR
jgi:transposase